MNTHHASRVVAVQFSAAQDASLAGGSTDAVITAVFTGVLRPIGAEIALEHSSPSTPGTGAAKTGVNEAETTRDATARSADCGNFI